MKKEIGNLCRSISYDALLFGKLLVKIITNALFLQILEFDIRWGEPA
jgi:hypothetical protein